MDLTSSGHHLAVRRTSRATLDDEEILRRLSLVSGWDRVKEAGEMLVRMKEQSPELGYPEYRERLLVRMYDVSVFMQELKKRFTWWYNKRVGRKGPLWEDRVKGVLVENDEKVLLTMAAYIDLNPVRAGLVKDPKDYRWSGYGEAVSGNRMRRLGLMKGFGVMKPGESRDGRSRKRYQAFYGKYLYGVGGESALENPSSRKRRGSHHPKAVVTVARQDGGLNVAQVVRARMRYFTNSVALGSQAWVEEVCERNRDRLRVKRERGARELKAPGLEPWRGLVDLRGSVE
ncbi:MAG: putative transposase [Verrucomicrobiales bacterium]|jgi:putative transposase